MRTKPTLLAVVLCLVAAGLAVWLLDREPPDRTRRSEAAERVPVREAPESPAASVSAPVPGTPGEPSRREQDPAEELTALAPEPQPVDPGVDRPAASNGALIVHVVDEYEVAWCGADVRLSRFGPDGTADPVKRETNREGRAEFADLAQGEWLLYVKVGDVCKQDVAAIEGGRKDLRVTIPRAGALLTGVVRHREKGPLAAVTVRLREPDSGARLSAQTNEAGEYRIEIVPRGTYRVTVEGGKTLGHQVSACPDLQVMAEGSLRRDLVVGFVSLRGVVRDATTGSPIRGALLQLQKPNRAQCRTDEKGEFRFYDVPAGPGKLLVSMEGYELRFVEVAKFRADVAQTRDVELARASLLHLHVIDERGAPVSGMLKLSVWGKKDHGTTADYTVTVRAGADGHATHGQIRPGTYNLRVRRGERDSPWQEFEIRAGENTAHFRIRGVVASHREDEPKVLSGTVADSRTGRPIRGAWIRVGTRPAREAYTDPQGGFGVWGLAPGTYALRVEKDGYGFRSMKFDVSAGEVRVVDIALEPAATLSLRIVDAGNRAVCGRVLLVVKPATKGTGTIGSVWLQVGEDGRASCRQILAGAYELRFLMDDRRTVLSAEIAPGDNFFDVRLE